MHINLGQTTAALPTNRAAIIAQLGPDLFARVALIEDGDLGIDSLNLKELESVRTATAQLLVIDTSGDMQNLHKIVLGEIARKKRIRRTAFLTWGGVALGATVLVGGGILIARRQAV